MADIFIANLPYLLRGLAVTLRLAFLGVTFGTLLGIGLGIAAVLAPAPIRAAITGYVFVVRGVPVLVWMFLGYYGLPAVGADLSDRTAVQLVLILYTGAFAAEITRGGVNAVPRQQIDGAKSLGMGWSMILKLVVLPQALKMSMPSLVNNSVMMVKQSAYVSIVGVWELSYAAREIVERTLAPFQIFLGVMIMYFVICYPLAMAARQLEKRLAYEH